MSETKVHNVRITESGVELDGEAVKRVRALQYTAVAGEVPRLSMEVWAVDGEVQSAALVETIVTSPVHSTALEFLGSINPADLDDEVLNRGDMATRPGEVYLEVLKEWARGSSS